MIKTEHPAAAKHQRRTTEANIGPIEEIQFLLDIYLIGLQFSEKTQGIIYLVDVLLNQGFGTKFRPTI